MTIKAREVAFIKTTGESVFVLEYPTAESAVTAKVRRPIMTRDGVKHETEWFAYDELETLDEQRKRFLSEREEIIQKYAPTPKASPVDDGGFFSN
jgi:hypothetical protein